MISRVNKILMVLCLSLVLLSQVGTTALARKMNDLGGGIGGGGSGGGADPIHVIKEA
ncbi:hypothetical protein ACF3M2_16590 [Tissierella carlieri]|uniref:hypothetical protein n=1 Tax=Tissierella carlieri TaxID=689904 RepID=UPI00280488BD|nr:hypothetical protein [uncultured Tissierella sp.]MDU5083362.1 hypothetical protein [Bacillota bacterium]